MTGSDFELLPDDVVGILSNHNEDPLEGRYWMNDNAYCSVVSKSENEIKLAAERSSSHEELYLGAIVSKDRTIVYWQNDSAPLP